MSRGFGRLERGVMALIERTSKPMTFVAIRAAMETKLRPTFDERSLRRAVHRLTEKCMLIAMGNGGPGDPLRYFVHPLRIGMMRDHSRLRMPRKRPQVLGVDLNRSETGGYAERLRPRPT